MITAIVLAAGKSSRMKGRNKMFLPFRNSTILSNVIAELVVSEVDEIIVVGDNINQQNELAIVSHVQFALNANPELGMTSSIKVGIQKAQLKSHFMICLGDMPLISTHEYNLLINKFIESKCNGIIQPVFQDIPGNPVLFSNNFRSKILELNHSEGCKPVLQNHTSLVIQHEMPSNSIHFDIDTEEDYQGLLNRISKP